ncbi:hypothetical protein TNCV_556781 [Trichonephila clavipes]|uniref:Uncharacterized protein n=1 Tax=Trichonephila clavipes TaxID=2585209 RepID=A0A8X6V7D4_TRICX|nr:hypothetical protein TNCV_556781 [Trichonephila clavipes]
MDTQRLEGPKYVKSAEAQNTHWCDVKVSKEGYELKCHLRHMTEVQTYKVRPNSVKPINIKIKSWKRGCIPGTTRYGNPERGCSHGCTGEGFDP